VVDGVEARAGAGIVATARTTINRTIQVGPTTKEEAVEDVVEVTVVDKGAGEAHRSNYPLLDLLFCFRMARRVPRLTPSQNPTELSILKC